MPHSLFPQRILPFLLATLVVLAACSQGLAGPRPGKKRTALDRYVAKPDPNYRFQLVSIQKVEGATAYVLSMTSQAWRTPAEVNRTQWEHWITVIQPAEV